MIGIYKIQNLINGKIYIGQSIHIKARFNAHKSEARNGNTRPLYNAIRKYGVENFSFEIIEECSKEKLNEREIYWIKKYDSFHNGYNLTPGGSEPYKVDIDLIYSLWDDGKSMKEIAEIANIGKTSVYNYLCDYKNYSVSESNRRGGILAYKTAIKNNNHYHYNNNCDDNLETKIIQYSLTGEHIKDWYSQNQIERELGINSELIWRVLNGKQKQAGGFQWRRIGDEPKDISKEAQYRFGVIQYDLNGNEVNRFPSLKAAAIAMKCDPRNISRVCKKENNRKTACGYKWEYDYSVYS